MIKVLVSDTDEKNNLKCCNLIANDKRFEVFNTFTGITTINKYYEIKPDIFILDSNFSDINGLEILNKISININEKQKCNTIFITNKEMSQNITKVSKIYEIVYKSYSFENIFILLHQMYQERNYNTLNIDEIYSFFCDFKIHLSSNGCEYLKSAIEICLRHYPFYGNSLDDLLKKLAVQYHKTPEQIRDGIKGALKPINISSQKYARELYPEIFNDDDLLSPRKFIERSTIYFHQKPKKK